MRIKFWDGKYFVEDVATGIRLSPECETYHQAKGWLDKIRKGEGKVK